MLVSNTQLRLFLPLEAAPETPSTEWIFCLLRTEKFPQKNISYPLDMHVPVSGSKKCQFS